MKKKLFSYFISPRKYGFIKAYTSIEAAKRLLGDDARWEQPISKGIPSTYYTSVSSGKLLKLCAMYSYDK